MRSSCRHPSDQDDGFFVHASCCIESGSQCPTTKNLTIGGKMSNEEKEEVKEETKENQLPDVGKISPEIFDEVIYPNLGAKSKAILVGPKHGVDIGVVDLGEDRVMVTTTDPVFIVPEYGFERAAWCQG